MMPGVRQLPVCPAAQSLDGPPTSGPSVVCCVVEQEAARSDQITHGAVQGQLITAKRDPSTLRGFCYGQALPAVGVDVEKEPRAHHTFCPIWRKEKERVWKHGKMVEAPPERGSTVPIDQQTGQPYGPPPDADAALSPGLSDLDVLAEED